MRYLLDTHAALWWSSAVRPIGRRALAAIADRSNEVLLGHVTRWELAIKSSLGKIRLSSPAGAWFDACCERNGFLPLPIDDGSIAAVEHLPLHHRDPFDRLLIAQARQLDLTIITADRRFHDYDVRLLW